MCEFGYQLLDLISSHHSSGTEEEKRKNIETYCLLYGTQRERRLSKAYVPGTGMVAAGQGKARWLTASLLSFQHQGDNTGLQVPWLRASLLNFQLQGYNAGLPVPLGHPHEHNRKA